MRADNGGVLDYDDEASRYDATRGGEARADAAVRAYAELLACVPAGPVVDLACGTGIVSAALARRCGRPVIGLDLSAGMLELAASRLPGRVIRADATRLPLPEARVPAVCAVWLLHLLPSTLVAVVLDEVARVLIPGGRFVTTVDKSGTRGLEASDHEARIADLGRARGLAVAGATSFVGLGQGEWTGTGRNADGPDPVYRVSALERSR